MSDGVIYHFPLPALNADAAADPSRRQHRHSHRRRHPSEAKVAAMGQDFPRSLHSKKGPLLKSRP